MFGGTLLLSIATFVLDPWHDYNSFSDSFHVSTFRIGDDTLGRIIFFNDASYGPYRGSLMQITDDQGNVAPVFEKEVYFGGSYVLAKWLLEQNNSQHWLYIPAEITQQQQTFGLAAIIFVLSFAAVTIVYGLVAFKPGSELDVRGSTGRRPKKRY